MSDFIFTARKSGDIIIVYPLLGVMMLTGTVFDIQRFSVHDGPGIRTTVFLKGCPLRCKWCHNPEGLSREPQLQFFAEKCLGCGACGGRDRLSDANACPSRALQICGKESNEDEIIAELLKDRIYYTNGGGVTVSGGECLMQADFTAAILKRAKELGIHTAVDTSGFAPWSELSKVIPYCDLFLYDVKCIDPTAHKRYTGVDNSQIIDNLRRLNEEKREIWVRVPVIPDFNCNVKEMTAIAELVSSMSSVKQVTLMPYHTLGASKYATLGIEYGYDTAKSVTKEELASFCEIFKSRNLVLS